MVVSQIEAREIDFGEDAEREAPQQVGVEEHQLQRRHGVEGAGVYLADLVVLEIKEPKESGAKKHVRVQKAAHSQCTLLRC